MWFTYPGRRLTDFLRCTYSKSRFIRVSHDAGAVLLCPLSFTGEEVLYVSRSCPLAYPVLIIFPVRAIGIEPTVFHQRVNRFFLSAGLDLSLVPLRCRFTELFCLTRLSPHLSLPVSELTLQIFVGHLVSSVSYRTGNSCLCIVRLLHTDLGQSDPLVATHRRVYVLRGIRQAQFPKFSFYSPQNFMTLFRSSSNLANCQGFARLEGLLYGLVWLLTH